MLDLLGRDEVSMAVFINYRHFRFQNSFWKSNCVTMSLKGHCTLILAVSPRDNCFRNSFTRHAFQGMQQLHDGEETKSNTPSTENLSEEPTKTLDTTGWTSVS